MLVRVLYIFVFSGPTSSHTIAMIWCTIIWTDTDTHAHTLQSSWHELYGDCLRSTSLSYRRETRATRCVMPTALYTKMNGQCDEPATVRGHEIFPKSRVRDPYSGNTGISFEYCNIGSLLVKNQLNPCSRFDTIPVCDTQTYRPITNTALTWAAWRR